MGTLQSCGNGPSPTSRREALVTGNASSHGGHEVVTRHWWAANVTQRCQSDCGGGYDSPHPPPPLPIPWVLYLWSHSLWLVTGRRKHRMSGRSSHVGAILGQELFSRLPQTKVLLVGAGGIGCELCAYLSF